MALFPGFRVGRAQLLSLDGVVNVAYLPDVDVDGLKVMVPGDRLKFGWGGRVGLLRDAKMIPAISASYIKRELPTADITADFEGWYRRHRPARTAGFQHLHRSDPPLDLEEEGLHRDRRRRGPRHVSHAAQHRCHGG